MSEYLQSFLRIALGVAVWGASAPVQAATLDDYLRAAYRNAFTVQLSRADVQLARAAQRKALAGLLPALQASGSYNRNQYETAVTLPGAPGSAPNTVVITPKNQWDGSINLTVPLIDGGAWERLRAANWGESAADAQSAADINDVLMTVIQGYYDALYTEQVVLSAQHTLQAAQGTWERTQIRQEAGMATPLDMRRAEADVGRARQALADAQVSHGAALRNLGTLSSLHEAPGAAPAARALPADTSVEHALAQRTEVQAARADAEEANATASSTAWAYAPQLVGKASERFTNATGFTGKTAMWEAGVALQWNLFDSGAREATLHDAQARAQQADVRLQKAMQKVRDDVADAQQRYEAARIKLAAADQEDAAAQESLRLVNEQQDAGRATSLDVTLAVRDGFVASVSRARAVADLAVASETLRHALGMPLWEE